MCPIIDSSRYGALNTQVPVPDLIRSSKRVLDHFWMERRYEMPSTSSKVAAYLLGLLCGSVPLLMFTLALFSRTEESQLVGLIVGVILRLLATFLMFLLTLPQRTRPIAYGLFIPLLSRHP